MTGYALLQGGMPQDTEQLTADARDAGSKTNQVDRQGHRQRQGDKAKCQNAETGY